MNDKVRVLRVLEYVGTKEGIEFAMKRRWVKSIGAMTPSVDIREISIMSDCPEITDAIKE